MSTERRYDPKTVEPKWQAVWEREHTWEVSNDDARGADTYYVAEMLPYPSGEPHMGHLKNYAVGDAVAHFQRRMGRRVLHPIGYDAFGLPAENHAIRSGEHPRESSASSIAAFQREFRSWGVSFDWTRECRDPPGLLPLDAVDLPQALRARAGLSLAGGGQLVPEGPDGAGQRAGHRRPLRALRDAGGGAPARAVVLPHHRLRRPPAGRPRHGRMAVARGAHAAELDRALRGRRGDVHGA